MSNKSKKLLTDIRKVLTDLIKDIDSVLIKEDKHEVATHEGTDIIVSCDGSILKNPGGRCSAGAVIQVPKTKPVEIVQFTPSSTNNEAEFDAVYIGLSNIRSPEYPILVESDSRVVIDGINKKSNLKAPNLIKKRDLILEITAAIPVPVTFVWKKRNSTAGMRRANDIAQSLNGVTPH